MTKIETFLIDYLVFGQVVLNEATYNILSSYTLEVALKSVLGIGCVWWLRTDLKKVLNPSGSAKLELRSFCACLTPKSSNRHFSRRISSYRCTAILVLILEISYFRSLCRRKFYSISISGLGIEKCIL